MIADRVSRCLVGGDRSRCCALVTDDWMMADAIRAFSILMPGEIKVFPSAAATRR
jgi:hypothetical protein